LNVKKKFVVPFNSEEWPEMLWGLELGVAASNLKAHGRYASQQVLLDEIGFLRPDLEMLVKKKIEVSKRRFSAAAGGKEDAVKEIRSRAIDKGTKKKAKLLMAIEEGNNEKDKASRTKLMKTKKQA